MPTPLCSTIVKEWDNKSCQAQYCYKNDHSWIENGLQYSCVPTSGDRVCSGISDSATCKRAVAAGAQVICQLPSASPT